MVDLGPHKRFWRQLACFTRFWSKSRRFPSSFFKNLNMDSEGEDFWVFLQAR